MKKKNNNNNFNFLSNISGDELSNDDRKKRPRTAFTAAQVFPTFKFFQKQNKNYSKLVIVIAVNLIADNVITVNLNTVNGITVNLITDNVIMVNVTRMLIKINCW